MKYTFILIFFILLTLVLVFTNTVKPITQILRYFLIIYIWNRYHYLFLFTVTCHKWKFVMTWEPHQESLFYHNILISLVVCWAFTVPSPSLSFFLPFFYYFILFYFFLSFLSFTSSLFSSRLLMINYSLLLQCVWLSHQCHKWPTWFTAILFSRLFLSMQWLFILTFM